ncbi:MAG: transcription antitermination factor NusB [Kiloniellales bacterium]
MNPAPRPTSQKASRRSAARLAAVQALYQSELTAAPVAEIVDEFVAHRLGREIEGIAFVEADPEFFADLVLGAVERQGEIDGLITGALAEGWPLERLDSTLRAMLRAGTYELLARPDVPARVVITEYVDIAHAFFEGLEPGFVNGVLDRLGHILRPGKLEGNDGERPARAG